MAWFDDPTQFFITLDEAALLTQGDIVVAPTVLIEPGTGEEGVTGPSDLGQDRRTTIWRASDTTYPAAPNLTARTAWGLAMIVPHPCAMEKEWNERIRELLAEGVAELDARAAADADVNLDPYVTLAAFVPYENALPKHVHGIQTNQRLGAFPVCHHEDMPDGYIDLRQLSTVHHTVVSRASRIAALTDLALAHLHHSLAMHFAYRGNSPIAEIEAAIGHSIVDAKVTRRAKSRVVVNLILDDGSDLTLESQDKPTPDDSSLERSPRQ